MHVFDFAGIAAKNAYRRAALDTMNLTKAHPQVKCIRPEPLPIADGKKAEAKAIYQSLAGPDQPKHVHVAATHGLLVVAGKKD